MNMMDYLSSKIALGIASLLLVASAGGIFHTVKIHNEKGELQQMVGELADILWELNRSAVGTTAILKKGEGILYSHVKGDWQIMLYNGLAVVEMGFRLYSSCPPLLFVQGDRLLLDSYIVIEKVHQGLFIDDNPTSI